jgi:hypothetical protein
MGRTRPVMALPTLRPPSEPGPDDAIPVDARSVDVPRLARTMPRQPRPPERSRPPSVTDASLAESTEDAPALARALAPPRMAGVVSPEGALRPTAVLERSLDGRHRRDLTPLDDDGPVVHVSIGRIEVRAAQPPPARPATRPVAPGLSLDAYLRRRDEAAQR